MKKNKENELLSFKHKAIDLGLCDQYKMIWDKCYSKADLMDMALDANGAEFVADAIAFDWGLSKDYLMQEFGGFINGQYQRFKGGYTGEMYVGAHGIIELKSTITLIAYCNSLNINVSEHFVGKVYVCGNSEVHIENKGNIELYEYGSNDVELIEQSYSHSSRKTIEASMWKE